VAIYTFRLPESQEHRKGHLLPNSCYTDLVESFHCAIQYQSNPAATPRPRSCFQGDDVTRRRLILGSSIVVILILLTISGLVFFREWRGSQASVDQRFPLQELKYCSPSPVTPCVVSFSQDSDGNMLVNLLTEGAFYPDFYLKITAGETDHIYVCQKANTFATSVYCTGKALPAGEVLHFFVISLNEDIVLAQGNFPIIGIALAGPGVFSPPTVTPEVTPSPSYPSYPGIRP
jgi:hypothetical protein